MPHRGVPCVKTTLTCKTEPKSKTPSLVPPRYATIHSQSLCSVSAVQVHSSSAAAGLLRRRVGSPALLRRCPARSLRDHASAHFFFRLCPPAASPASSLPSPFVAFPAADRGYSCGYNSFWHGARRAARSRDTDAMISGRTMARGLWITLLLILVASALFNKPVCIFCASSSLPLSRSLRPRMPLRCLTTAERASQAPRHHRTAILRRHVPARWVRGSARPPSKSWFLRHNSASLLAPPCPYFGRPVCRRRGSPANTACLSQCPSTACIFSLHPPSRCQGLHSPRTSAQDLTR